MRRLQQVLTQGSSQRRAAQDQLTTFKTQAEREANDADYYDVLAAESRKLQNRVADIVKALAFQGDESSDLMIAIPALQSQGRPDHDRGAVPFLGAPGAPGSPRGLGDEPRLALQGPLVPPRMGAIKVGHVELIHSYKYRSLTTT